MKLYAATGACSLGPHIALHELGLEHQLELVDIRKGEASTPQFLARNPLGMVPVLEIEPGRLLTECSVILQYLADQKPQLRLAPAPASAERYRLQELLSIISTELHKSFLPLFYGQKILPDDHAARKQLGEFFVRRLEPRWQKMADELTSRDWLLESGFSVADIYLYVIMTWWQRLGRSFEPWPRLVEFFGRVKQRPAVVKAHDCERPVRDN